MEIHIPAVFDGVNFVPTGPVPASVKAGDVFKIHLLDRPDEPHVVETPDRTPSTTSDGD